MESFSMSDAGHETEVAGFIAKTFQILKTQDYSKIIFWSQNGKEFIIKDINKFEEVVLPKYFRHQRINSFIRQLNMYGFHKSRKDSSKCVFSHSQFIRDRQDLLPQIKRKVKIPKTPQKKSENEQNCEKVLIQTAPKAPKEMKSQFSIGFIKQSMENIQSVFHLNHSLKRISLQGLYMSEMRVGSFVENQQNRVEEIDDRLSIEDNIEYQGEMRQNILLDPQMFFNSFIGHSSQRI